jgi:hypothetical protein
MVTCRGYLNYILSKAPNADDAKIIKVLVYLRDSFLPRGFAALNTHPEFQAFPVRVRHQQLKIT